MWADKYDVGTADSDTIPYDTDEMEDFIEEASIAEKERYRLLLTAALGGGVVQPADKDKLELYREMHAIPDEEHRSLLFEQGWKEEEFEAGFQKDIASSHFQQYAALVKKELAKGEVGKGWDWWKEGALRRKGEVFGGRRSSGRGDPLSACCVRNRSSLRRRLTFGKDLTECRAKEEREEVGPLLQAASWLRVPSSTLLLLLLLGSTAVL